MKNLLKEMLLSAIIILVISCLIAFTTNAIRSDRLKLIPETPWETIIGSSQTLCQEGIESVTTIEPDKALLLLNRTDVIFIDIRSNEAYNEGHIPNAINIPIIDCNVSANDNKVEEEIILSGIDILDTKTLFIIYCNEPNCEMSRLFAKILLLKGCKHVGVLNGGWPNWRYLGFPTQS